MRNGDAFLCFNYFFLPPVGTWTIADPENWVALFTLLAVSIVASHLSAQVRRRAQEATARRDELGRLFELTRDILLTTDASDAIALVAGYVARRFGLKSATICLPESHGWKLHHSGERSLELEAARLDSALAAARIEFDANDRTYAGHSRVDLSNGTTVWLVPLRLGARPIGVLALEMKRSNQAPEMRLQASPRSRSSEHNFSRNERRRKSFDVALN